MAMFEEGELIYEDGRERWLAAAGAWSLIVGIIRQNPKGGGRKMASAILLNSTGMTILLIKDSDVIMQKMSGYLGMTCSVLLLFAGIFTVFIYHVSKDGRTGKWASGADALGPARL